VSPTNLGGHQQYAVSFVQLQTGKGVDGGREADDLASLSYSSSEEASDEATGSRNSSHPDTRQWQTRDVWHLKARYAAFEVMADKHSRIGVSRAR